MITVQQFSAVLIATFEGQERLTAYQDGGGVWTIGIGHTKGVTKGMKITHEQSVAFFAQDQAPLLKLVEGLPVLEAGALVSYGFNNGIAALKKLLAGQNQILNAVHDKQGRLEPGLVARRALEDALIKISRGL